MAETLRAGTVPGVSSPMLRSSASGVAGIFGGARKVEVSTYRQGRGLLAGHPAFDWCCVSAVLLCFVFLRALQYAAEMYDSWGGRVVGCSRVIRKGR